MSTGQKDNGQEANGCMEWSSQQGGHISFSTILGKGLGAAMCSKGGKVPRCPSALQRAPRCSLGEGGGGAKAGGQFPEARALSQKGRGLCADPRWLGAGRARKTMSPGRAGIKEMRTQMEWDLSAKSGRGPRRPPGVRGGPCLAA